MKVQKCSVAVQPPRNLTYREMVQHEGIYKCLVHAPHVRIIVLVAGNSTAVLHYDGYNLSPATEGWSVHTFQKTEETLCLEIK